MPASRQMFASPDLTGLAVFLIVTTAAGLASAEHAWPG
jgi:hypothetical protein